MLKEKYLIGVASAIDVCKSYKTLSFVSLAAFLVLEVKRGLVSVILIDKAVLHFNILCP